MTTFTLQNESSAPTFTNQDKNSTSFTLQDRDLGRSPLLYDDTDSDDESDYLTTESGDQIILEQATQGDVWSLQSKS